MTGATVNPLGTVAGATVNPLGTVAGADDRPDAVAAPHPQVRDRRAGGDRQVAFEAVAGAEVEARREVHREPRLQLAVGDRLPHIGRGGAGGDRPVHATHVVAGAIFA